MSSAAFRFPLVQPEMPQVADDCPDVVRGEAVTKRCSLIIQTTVRSSRGKRAAFALQRRFG